MRGVHGGYAAKVGGEAPERGKAFISKDIVDGFWFGWSVGCPRFCLDDGIHGLSFYTPEEEVEKYRLTGFNYSTKEDAIEAWNDRVDAGEWRISPWKM